MDYRDNRQRSAESHQVVHFYAGQWCTFTPALTLRAATSAQRSSSARASAASARARSRSHCDRQSRGGALRHRHGGQPDPAITLDQRQAGAKILVQNHHVHDDSAW